MKKLKKIFIIIILLIFIGNLSAFASNTLNSEQEVEYSEAYLEWLELSDEEKQNVMMPRMYEVPYTKFETQNPLYKAERLKTSSDSSYSLKDIISSNLAIRNQEETGSCWAFAALSSLETNLALANYKSGTNTSKVYDFSERHMEYATSRVFENNEINSIGYNREVGSGGSWDLASSYLTNGSGAINESEMPFENNENTINIAEIQGKTVTSQVYDTVEFPDYNNFQVDETEANEIKNQIKYHIQNYGAIFGSIIAGGSFGGLSTKVSDTTGAVAVGGGSYGDHAISVIGWDDNYSISNWEEFPESDRPTSNGAWIARNSWGEEKGDNGLIYISYEDETLSNSLSGIVKATDTVEYENIYQYDYYYPNYDMSEGVSETKIMICNVFNKKTNGAEYLTQVSLHVPEACVCKVYVNPTGAGKSKDDLQLVQLEAGETETFDVGYHTLEFAEPIEITSDEFAVAIEISSIDDDSVNVSYVKNSNPYYSVVEVQTGRCFILSGYEYRWNDDWSGWEDLGEDDVPRNSTIKAFTTSKLIDDSLKNIEITTPPTKTEYWAGENFDATGMVVTANYNNDTSCVLESSDYSISNATNLKAGQTSVTITYEDKTIEQSIKVIENKIESIAITTPPTKTEYWAGDDFDKTGMIIEATYTDKTTKQVTDYTIIDGSSLKNGQETITISYEEKTIEQEIIVNANSVIKIEITKAPNKTNYVVNQNFDNEGMVVKATYANGTIKEVADYEIKDGKKLYEGQEKVTISYEGQTVTQDITVVEKSITGIGIKTMPNKIQYIQNKEELDLTGGVIEITYNDGTKENIEMTSEEVSVEGFTNSNLGKMTITLTYQTKTTYYEIQIIEETITEEPIIEEKAENSKMDNAVTDVKKVKAYYFTDNSQNDYTIIELEVNDIEKNLNNDKMEYYYYLSSNSYEENITDWVKITETQDRNDSLKFTIDSSKIANYNEIVNANVVYLYIKEVAIKGGNQSVEISKAMTLETDTDIEIYMDNVKKENQQVNDSNENSIEDNTISPEKIPNTGAKLTILIVIIVLSIVGISVFVRYKNLSKDI